MPKELFISSSPHETKVAVLDDDQLVEVYYERDTDVGLVGGIYKGRVNRVLPGMQSAFVDIGLERDAFLYVSDFFEDADEYDKIVTEAEARVTRFSEKPSRAPKETRVEQAEPPAATPPEEAPVAESAAPPVAPPPEEAGQAAVPAESAPPSEEATAEQTSESASQSFSERPRFDRPRDSRGRDHRGRDHRGRHRRRRGRRFDGNRPPRSESREHPAQTSAAQEESASSSFEVLPGESLAKYSHPASEASVSEPSEIAESQAVEQPESAAPQTETVTEVSPKEETAVTAVEQPEVAEPAPAAVEPVAAAAPEHEEASPAEPNGTAAHSEESEEKPRPLWNRFVSNFFREAPEIGEENAAPEAAAESEPAHAEATPAESVQESPVAEATSDSEVEHDEGETHPEAEAQESEGEPEAEEAAHSDETAGDESSQPDSSSESAERSYTLREPTRAPHFAPRRRRGRRGRGRRDFRPSGKKPRQEARPGNHQPVQISELLKEGQEILVQIAKEPLGRKGARITSHIALPGRYLVYMPTVDHIGVSRKIGSEEERLRLRNLILENKGPIPGGFIVRTAAASKPDDELIADIHFLSTLWSDIRRKAESIKAPVLLHADLSLVQRILRDTLSPDFKTIWLDSEIEYERTVEFVNRCQPSLVGHVKLYTRNTPLFEEFAIESEIEKALKPKVWLKSGGYIVINQTEALVAIDVNTGKYVGKTNRLEDTIVKTNIDAVNEIVRQIRMRDLGGIIVIDFIDMDERRNRNKVVGALEEALRKDRAPTKILSFNDFGLVAVTRKRVKQSLERTLCEPCSYCTGAGWIKSVTTVCNEILAEARKMASQLEGDVVTLRVNPDVARALKSGEGASLNELEYILHKDVIVKGDATVHQERFEIYS